MKRILLTLMLVIGTAVPMTTLGGHHLSTPYAVTGESPFPWGSESPFPWKIVDGLWKTTTAPLYFKFEVIRVNANTKYLRVQLIDDQGKLAEGVGVMRDQDQIIRARVIGKRVDAYALVRAYNRKKVGRTCGARDCVMVVTLRENEAVQGKDLHYMLEKVP